MTTTSTTSTLYDVFERNIVLEGKDYYEISALLDSYSSLDISRKMVIKGILAGFELERTLLLSGKDYLERELVLDSKSYFERNLVVEGYISKQPVFKFVEDDITDFSIKSVSSDLVNRVELNYGYNWGDSSYTKSIIKKENSSYLIYGERKKVFNMRMIQFTRQANELANSILRHNSFPVWKISFSHDIRSFFVEVGDYVSITHRAGISIGGWENHICIVIEKRLISNGIINYSLLSIPEYNTYPELISLSETPEAIKESVAITYENGVATLTIMSESNPPEPVEGLSVRIGDVTQITNVKGQVRFELSTGRYTVYITGQGYKDVQYEIFV